MPVAKLLELLFSSLSQAQKLIHNKPSQSKVLYLIQYQILKKNSDLTRYVMDNHPIVLEEIKRVEMDMELAQRYPQNMEEILQKRMEYHELNICDNHLLECSFVRNALNAHMIRML